MAPRGINLWKSLIICAIDSHKMKILGIETSCDETAAAVVNDSRNILSNVVRSQLEEHAPYGGIVPEIAARAHISTLDYIITKSMTEAKV